MRSALSIMTTTFGLEQPRDPRHLPTPDSSSEILVQDPKMTTSQQVMSVQWFCRDRCVVMRPHCASDPPHY
jgi:hypothetical protein